MASGEVNANALFGGDTSSIIALVERLPSFGARRAVGLRGEFGLRWWTYERLYRECHRVAALLEHRGISAGDRVLLVAPNCPEWVAFALGALLKGIVIVPLDAGVSDQMLLRLAKRVNAVLIAYDPTRHDTLTDIPQLSIYLTTGDPTAASPHTVYDASPGDTALISFTSGTTASPRGVIITHGNLLAATAPYQAWRLLLRFMPYRLLCVAPLSRILGLMLGIFVPLSIGLSVIYSRSIEVRHLERTVRDNRVTLLATVPRVLQMLSVYLRDLPYFNSQQTLESRLRPQSPWLLRRHILFRHCRSRLGHRFSVILVGGAVLASAEEQFWRDAGYIVVQGYGMTETTAFSLLNAPLGGGAGTIGRAVKGLETRLAPDGELLVRGPTVTPGYFEDPAATAAAMRDGFFRTGDFVERGPRQRYIFRGRRQGRIVTDSGQNVYAEDVEAVLNRLNGVRDSIVFGAKRADGGEEVHAVLLLSDRATANAIIATANKMLETYQRIANWTVWPESEFPRNPMLKTQRHEVIKRARRLLTHTVRRHTMPAQCPRVEDIHATADREQRLKLIARYLVDTPQEALAENENTLAEQFDLSSLDLAELLIVLEATAGASLDNASALGMLDHLDAATLKDAIQQQHDHARGRAPPRWSEVALLQAARHVLRGSLVAAILQRRARLSVSGRQHLCDVQGPFLLAVTHHQQATDVLAVFRALPRRLRNKLMVVSGDWAFGAYLAPNDSHDWRQRLLARFAFHIGVPLLFPFTIVPRSGASAHGLMDTCRLVDRGFCPLIFPERFRSINGEHVPLQPGLALVALQCQIPVIPVRLCGNQRQPGDRRHPKPVIGVQFGEPLSVSPTMTQQMLIQTLETRFAHVADTHNPYQQGGGVG